MDEKEVKDEEIVEEEVEELTEEEKMIKFINRSTYRKRAFKAIGNDVKMPKEIAHDSGILQNHISTVLRQLKDKALVECLNPKIRKGRLYRLTEDGLEYLDKID